MRWDSTIRRDPNLIEVSYKLTYVQIQKWQNHWVVQLLLESKVQHPKNLHYKNQKGPEYTIILHYVYLYLGYIVWLYHKKPKQFSNSVVHITEPLKTRDFHVWLFLPCKPMTAAGSSSAFYKSPERKGKKIKQYFLKGNIQTILPMGCVWKMD